MLAEGELLQGTFRVRALRTSAAPAAAIEPFHRAGQRKAGRARPDAESCCDVDGFDGMEFPFDSFISGVLRGGRIFVHTRFGGTLPAPVEAVVLILNGTAPGVDHVSRLRKSSSSPLRIGLSGPGLKASTSQ